MMKYQSFLIKYAEIGIKGKNRYLFEDALMRRIKESLLSADGSFKVTKESGRIYIEAHGEYDCEEVIDRLRRVFGISGICPMVQIEDNGFEDLCARVIQYIGDVYPDGERTFKVQASRARKDYPMDSQEINAELGDRILTAFPKMRVDVHNPDVLLRVEIRNHINIYSEVIPGPCGMPVGTAGSAMLLLSGGIDSPVAGYMMAKRGVAINAVYFHAPPYTSERARQKVIDLAKIVSAYAGKIKLFVVNFTEIQLYIYDKCPHDELTVIMRRYMMRIAQRFAEKEGNLGLITGESVGQVASQTMHSLAATNAVCRLPVYRPLIAFDKQDIINLALKIGTYETSILPYEDCCTIFVAKHPVTKPDISRIQKSESRLSEEIDRMIEDAVNGAQEVLIG